MDHKLYTKYIKELKEANPLINTKPGIYFLLREDNGFKFCYIGQAKNLTERLVSHLGGFQQHIDKSLKKHGLWSQTNTTGWKLYFINCDESQLDELEQKYIKNYACNGYQLYNITGGSQSVGKVDIKERKSPKGYYDGVSVGYNKCKKEIQAYFEKYLDFSLKGKPNKTKERKYVDFAYWLKNDL